MQLLGLALVPAAQAGGIADVKLEQPEEPKLEDGMQLEAAAASVMQQAGHLQAGASGQAAMELPQGCPLPSSQFPPSSAGAQPGSEPGPSGSTQAEPSLMATADGPEQEQAAEEGDGAVSRSKGPHVAATQPALAAVQLAPRVQESKKPALQASWEALRQRVQVRPPAGVA